jgi:predicted secreted protein
MKDYSAGHTVKRGEEFVIKLESNPTSGYSWHPAFDQVLLELISHEFIPRKTALGARGEDRFYFKAIKEGITTIKMIYKRSWEKKIEKENEFFICVT